MRQKGRAVMATQRAIEHLGYIQIDTISVVQRAHHHTLWNRNPRYSMIHLDELLADQQIFEYWSHAAAYLPLRDFRFSLPRKQALATGVQKHWYERDETMMALVLQRIAAEGPLMAKDFDYAGEKLGEWKTKPAKRALETLFMQGDLMVPRRINFHKVYDLTERVLPRHTDTRIPDSEEYARFLIHGYLRANGLAQPGEIAYLLNGVRPLVITALREMLSAGEVLQIKVADQCYYTLPASLGLLNKPLARRQLKILSPFDNLVIQRKRIKALFDFDYLIECYVPEAKRRYGYFALPILWRGKLVARMDCKVNRHESLLHVHHFVLEPSVSKTDDLLLAFRQELGLFLQFNGCHTLRLGRVSPTQLKPVLQRAVADLID